MHTGPDTLPAGWDCHVHVFDGALAVSPGHYAPAHAPLEQIEAVGALHGVGHLVLVQPSVYGSDNSLLLRALALQPGRHRGVVVLDSHVQAPDLDRLHAAGVRGVRFNLVSPAGHIGSQERVAADLHRLAPHLRRKGWHVQWYVTAQALPQLVRWQTETGLCFVLDHLAGLTADLAPTSPTWAAAHALAQGGAWIKLSGWYRLAERAPYAQLQTHVQRLAAMFGSRMVWGSDWPHTWFAPGQRPDYGSTLAPVNLALGDNVLHLALVEQAAALYA